MGKLSVQKKVGMIIAAVLILAVAVPAMAQPSITGPTVTDGTGAVLGVTSNLAGPSTWASARASIPLGTYQTLLGVYDITPPSNYTGGGTVTFTVNGCIGAQIYHYDGVWVKLNSTFNESTNQVSATTPNFSAFAVVVTTSTYQPGVSGTIPWWWPGSTSDWPWWSPSPTVYPNITTVLGVSVADSKGYIPAGSASYVSSSSTISEARAALGVGTNQTLSLYDIGNLDGASPYTVTFTIPAGSANTSVYTLGNTGVWTKMYGNTTANSVTVLINGPAVLGVVNTFGTVSTATPTVVPTAVVTAAPTSSYVPGTIHIVLPAGTKYYAINWVAGSPIPQGDAYVLNQATMVTRNATFNSGYFTFSLNGSNYVARTDTQPSAAPSSKPTAAPAPKPSIEPLPFF